MLWQVVEFHKVLGSAGKDAITVQVPPCCSQRLPAHMQGGTDPPASLDSGLTL